MTDFAKIVISLDACGMGTLSLNGMDLSNHVLAVEFKGKSGEVTEIKLTLMGHVEADVSALLEHCTLVIPDPADAESVVAGRTYKFKPAASVTL